MNDKCGAKVTIGGKAGAWFFCELEKGHIGRHQVRFKQSTKDRNWIVILWDADERDHP